MANAYHPIEDYAVIGDCRTAAVVSKDGSLDWLCLPDFGSPSVFGAIVDDERGGRFRIRPRQPFHSSRRYLPETNVLETTFHTDTGSCVLRDLMTIRSEERKAQSLTADHEVLREVEGLEGDVELEVWCQPSRGYGERGPTLKDRGVFGFWWDLPRGALTLRASVPLESRAAAHVVTGATHIRAGDRTQFSLTYSHQLPAVLPSLGPDAERRVDESLGWWRSWAAQCAYQGPYREAVVRSALTLKLMVFAPSGAIIAAPTTSLPEAFGGERNWDYRYCWLRDASLTLHALLALGYHEEADAFRGWILQATRLTWPKLQVLYGVYGESHLPERVLTQLEGYGHSLPVRIGNDAHRQLQLDVYGETVVGLAGILGVHERLDRESARMLRGIGDTVCDHWSEPDEGIWEIRGGRFQHTHSKVLCWAALDRLIGMHQDGHLEVPVERYRAVRDTIRSEIEERGFNRELGSYVSTFGGTAVDASLLVLPFFGYVTASDPRMRGTIARIRGELGRGEALMRYTAAAQDGMHSLEGAFGICSFWLAECLTMAGECEEATRVFEALLKLGNDVGLFAEEFDPLSGAALGNFPQAFTHVGLINAALAIEAYGAMPTSKGAA